MELSLIGLTKYLRALDDSMSLHQLETLLMVGNAGPDGITMREIEKRMGCPNATLSRNISYWSKWRRQGKPGMDFVEAHIDPSDRRYRIARLTPKGKAFYNELLRMMED
jgi:DNA-binding MarR family transcriptional regulator